MFANIHNRNMPKGKSKYFLKALFLFVSKQSPNANIHAVLFIPTKQQHEKNRSEIHVNNELQWKMTSKYWKLISHEFQSILNQALWIPFSDQTAIIQQSWKGWKNFWTIFQAFCVFIFLLRSCGHLNNWYWFVKWKICIVLTELEKWNHQLFVTPTTFFISPRHICWLDFRFTSENSSRNA